MLAIMSPRFHFESHSPRPDAFPFSAVEETFEAFDSFDPFGSASFGGGARMMMPRQVFDAPFYASGHNVVLKDGAYKIKVQTPGVKQENLQVELLGRRSLIVTNSDNAETEEGQEQQEQQEQHKARQRFSPFSHPLCKRIDLPCDADSASVQLRYADGLLTVEVAQKKHEDTAVEEGEEAATLLAEMKEGAARVEALRAELEAAQQKLVTSQRTLRQARMHHAQSLTQERRLLSFAAPKQQDPEAAKAGAEVTQPKSEVTQPESEITQAEAPAPE